MFNQQAIKRNQNNRNKTSHHSELFDRKQRTLFELLFGREIEKSDHDKVQDDRIDYTTVGF